MKTGLAGPFQQAKQRGPLVGSCSTPDHDHDSTVWLGLYETEKIVAVAGQEHTTAFIGKMQHCFIGRVAGECVTKEDHFVAELLKQIAEVVRDILIEQKRHSVVCDVWRATSKSISPRWSS